MIHQFLPSLCFNVGPVHLAGWPSQNRDLKSRPRINWKAWPAQYQQAHGFASRTYRPQPPTRIGQQPVYPFALRCYAIVRGSEQCQTLEGGVWAGDPVVCNPHRLHRLILENAEPGIAQQFNQCCPVVKPPVLPVSADGGQIPMPLITLIIGLTQFAHQVQRITQQLLSIIQQYR